MKMIKQLVAMLAISAAASSHAIVATSETDSDVLAGILAGSGITISNAQYIGGSVSAGTFTGGLASGIGIDSGVILSSGNVASVAGPNTSTSTSTNVGTAGSAALSALSGVSTNDAAILEFDFEFNGGAGGDLSFNFVFGSEEYNEYVGSSFNDVFAVFLDGVNLATLPDSSPVSINTVNNGSNSELYVDNNDGAFDTEMDGFTTVLSYDIFGLDAGIHNLSFQIADGSDSILDSWLMMEAGSVTTVNSVPELSASMAPISALLLAGLLALGVERRRKQNV